MNKVVQMFEYRTAYDIQLSKLNTQVNDQTQVWNPHIMFICNYGVIKSN